MTGTSQPRVLFVVEYFPPHVGGVETLFGELAGELVRRGVAVTVITSRGEGEKPRDVWRGAQVHRVRSPFARRYLFMLAALPAAIREARRAHVVHTTTYNAALPAWLAATLAGKPRVITVHEVFAGQWNDMPGMNRLAGYGYRLFERIALALPFDRYVCPSDFTRRRLVRYGRTPAERTRTVFNAIDYSFWTPARHTGIDLASALQSDGTKFYLYFGRPGVSKGVEYLVEAAAQVSRRVPESRLVMLLSDDPASQWLKVQKKIDSLGLRNHVIVRPPVERDALPSWLLGADCVVLPSLSEGFGYAALEAASLGCRIVTTSGHSVEELIPDSATFVPTRDPDALARAIEDALTTPAPARPAPPVFTNMRHADAIVEVYRDAGVPI